jgi:predicted HD phosphohydrolase
MKISVYSFYPLFSSACKSHTSLAAGPAETAQAAQFFQAAFQNGRGEK